MKDFLSVVVGYEKEDPVKRSWGPSDEVDGCLRRVSEGEVLVAQPVLEVPASVLGSWKCERFAAQECDAFCLDFAHGARQCRVNRVVQEDVCGLVKERLARQADDRFDRKLSLSGRVPLHVPIMVLKREAKAGNVA